MDHSCDPLDFVVVGIYRSRGRRTDSSSAGHRRRRGPDPSYSGTQVMGEIDLTNEGEGVGKQVGRQVRKDLAKPAEPFSQEEFRNQINR